MKEKIILAPGLNGNEFIRTLALHQIPTMNLRICNAAELAGIALMRSGIAVREKYISENDACALMAAAADHDPYFSRVTFSDIQQITRAVNEMRYLAVKEEESEIRTALEKGPFQKKNQALLRVYQNYQKLRKEAHAIDGIALIRKAVEEASPVKAEFIRLKEFPLNPLEQALLDAVSEGNAGESCLSDFFQVAEEDGGIQISTYRNCYGLPNEIESIISDIYKNRKADQCIVALSDPSSYVQLFYDYALQYSIPITFGCGIPVMNSYPARLLSLYLFWMTDGFYGKDALRAILTDPSFDKRELLDSVEGDTPRLDDVINLAGQIRITRDRERNKRNCDALQSALAEELTLCKNETETAEVQRKINAFPCVKALAETVAENAEFFIQKYAYLRKPSSTHLAANLDSAALKDMAELMGMMRRSSLTQSEEDIIHNVLKLTVMRQNSTEGALHVTDIGNAAAAIRDHLYLCGMSASRFPGSPKENYLLLDEDLNKFPEGGERYSSGGRILHRKQQLSDLVHLAGALHVSVSVSYAGMNVSELKSENPSSALFELYKAEHGSTVTIRDLDQEIKKIGYFEPPVSATRKIGEAYIHDRLMENGNPSVSDEIPVPSNLDRAYSPSALDTFFGCPRRFQLRYLLNIPEPEENDPFAVIPANDFGTLAHTMMEKLNNSAIDRKTFLDLSEAEFNRYIKENPPVIQSYIPKEKEGFLDTMANAYDMNPRREVILCEEEINETHESGVKIHGLPDCVERKEDGKCLIADYKTGRRIRHEKDNADTCLQVLIYAYMMEKQGVPIDGCEYRYLRLGETVTCRYDDEMKEALNQKLEEFRTVMEKGVFETVDPKDQPDTCKYCHYQSICGRKTETEGDEDE